ncbi:hypothetical protein [Clostridium septicum]|uniref:Polymer-forming cytoskeletal protein n=1 Tax=Clostridium septicum TaxID=1504 RepID=A0A9N7JNC4_CLOSE|nr:hypothetical protein [Clostridium septicum]AYE34986.1 hypothetical protein CP523_11490 [Clostridium septicum]MDU1314622.1 hypothetical protein [Clostridium septicum]QAS60379.1 hypothetical protein EI377_06305 [Clostridium septicum]UEC20364.1 hypothetical protein LK444_13330 [Clostridium septicum]USS01583.1 hypothetical protein NH397_03850 [Clostridium septicum]
MNNKNDIRVDGVGKVFGGDYSDIDISGMGTIIDNVKSSSIVVNGIGKSKGDIKTNNFVINGMFDIEGNAEINDLFEINGTFTFKGKVKGGNININGKAIVKEDMNFDNAIVNGVLKVKGICQCEKICVDGKVNIEGLLSGDKIELNIITSNKIREIGGEEVIVRKGINRKIRVLFISKEIIGKLICESIEADKILLEQTKCNIVRGHDITINSGCDIERVEYTGELKINGDSNIKETIKI